MEQLSLEPRKASDVLIDLELKINTLLQLVRSQDINIKILSNKLNALLDSKPIENISMESENITNKIQISAEDKLPIEQFPPALRRNSRPETYNSSNNDQFTDYKPTSDAEVIVDFKDKPIKNGFVKLDLPNEEVNDKNDQNHMVIPVHQRVVDRNGKSVFLADVDIINLDNNKSVFKTRTNGTGKWMASLNPGNYNIIIQKRESVSKEKVKIEQSLTILPDSSLIELQMIILK